MKKSNTQEALKQFYENPKRSIFIDTEIGPESFRSLSKDIQMLRGESMDPITIYINSSGGITDYANKLLNLLRSPSQDGRTCKSITVVPISSGSAASDILIHGDYAIAYPHSTIHYHGARHRIQYDINKKVADELLKDIEVINEFYSNNLAEKIFHRVFWIMIEFMDIEPSNIAGYVEQVKPHLSESNKNLVAEAFSKLLYIDYLYDSCEDILVNTTISDEYIIEKAVFEKLVESISDDTFLVSRQFECRDKSFKSEILPEIIDSFNLVMDYSRGTYKEFVENIIGQLGVYFLSAEEGKQFDKITDLIGKKEYVQKLVESRIRRLIYFVFIYCRLLQEDEYYFTPEEAFYLGLIDEVCGVLYPYRESVEMSYLDNDKKVAKSRKRKKKTI